MPVSRETSQKLSAFCDLVLRWNRSINLISKRSEGVIWERHLRDSMQVAAIPAQAVARWCDLGSGGGFPGLIVAVMRPDTSVSLIESDSRKATFLSSAARELGIGCTILCERAEKTDRVNADIVSARGLARLPQLLALTSRHGVPDAVHILPKGRAYAEELAAAKHEWSFATTLHPSMTEEGAMILALENVVRV